MESSHIECIAVVGKHNSPLFVKNFTEKPDLDLHYFANISLDAIEECLSDPKRSTEQYLGLVFFMENLNVYAYCTTTKIKFIAVIRWSGRPPLDAAVKSLLLKAHQSYATLVANPFYTMEGELRGSQAQRFVAALTECKLQS